MCLQTAAAKELRDFLDILRNSNLEGSLPDQELMIASACKVTSPPPKSTPTKTKQEKYLALFKAVQERLPGIFGSNNERNRAAKRAARAENGNSMNSISLVDLRQNLKDIDGSE